MSTNKTLRWICKQYEKIMKGDQSPIVEDEIDQRTRTVEHGCECKCQCKDK